MNSWLMIPWANIPPYPMDGQRYPPGTNIFKGSLSRMTLPCFSGFLISALPLRGLFPRVL